MHRIHADDYSDVLRQIGEFVARMAAAERHHASIVHKGKKIETAKAEHCAKQLDYLAETIMEQMGVVNPAGEIYLAAGKRVPPGLLPARQEPLTSEEERCVQANLGGRVE